MIPMSIDTRKFTPSLQQMLKVINAMLEDTGLWSRFAVAWTGMLEGDQRRLKATVEARGRQLFRELFEQLTPGQDAPELPFFFFDAEESSSSEFQAEVARAVALAASRQPVATRNFQLPHPTHARGWVETEWRETGRRREPGEPGAPRRVQVAVPHERTTTRSATLMGGWRCSGGGTVTWTRRCPAGTRANCDLSVSKGIHRMWVRSLGENCDGPVL
jgi:hypothetical protein